MVRQISSWYFLCHSLDHASNVPLVLNTTTANMSPHFHCLYDDAFVTCKIDTNFRSVWQIKSRPPRCRLPLWIWLTTMLPSHPILLHQLLILSHYQKPSSTRGIYLYQIHLLTFPSIFFMSSIFLYLIQLHLLHLFRHQSLTHPSYTLLYHPYL